MQDRPRKPCRSSEFGIGVQRIAIAAEPVEQRLLRQHGNVELEIRRPVRCGVRGRGAALATEPAFAAGEDRTPLRPQQRPVRRGHQVSDQITAALPLSQMSVNRVTAFAEPDGGSGAGALTCSLACRTLLSSMSMPGN